MAFAHRVLESLDAVLLLELHVADFAIRGIFGVDVGPEFDPHSATVVVEVSERGRVGGDGRICGAVVLVAVGVEMAAGVGEVEFGLGVGGTGVVVVILADYGLVDGSRA